MDIFNGQAGQDQFIVSILKEKRNGYFLEIGSNHPKEINNTYVLEKKYDWNGLMVEYDSKWEPLYKTHRTSYYTINDATKVDYKSLFEKYNFPKNMDYLQIDLEADNGSTINVLELLNNTIFQEYKFNCVTFEHDIYRGDFYNTRNRSRKIFEDNGYIRIFGDICDETGFYKFEDWYVNPDFIDIDYINSVKSEGPIFWKDAVNKVKI
jgi:hypothetical protein